jgi:Helicase conserved C-terminal domain
MSCHRGQLVASRGMSAPCHYEHVQCAPSFGRFRPPRARHADSLPVLTRLEATIQRLLPTWPRPTSTPQPPVNPAPTPARCRVDRMDGGTTAEDRQAMVKRFNKHPGAGVFLMSLKACSVGINLTSANRAVLCEPSWNPMYIAQVCALRLALLVTA